MTNTGAVTKYYHALGRAVAVRQSGTLSYLLADRLGSTLETLDGSGNTLNEMRYWPYGGTRAGGVPQTDKLYTGQQQEPDTAQPEIAGSSIGLYNYKARFYSTVTGRFLSVDPHFSDGLNRYAYVRNNPMRYADPTGMDTVCLILCTGSPDQVVVDDGRCGPQCQAKPDYQESSANAWVSSPAMEPSASCDMCRAWEGAAAGYAAAAAQDGLRALAEASARFQGGGDSAVRTWIDIGNASDPADYACQVVNCGEAKAVNSLGVNVPVCAFVCGQVEFGIVISGDDHPRAYAQGGVGVASAVGASIQPELAVGFSNNGITGFQGESTITGGCVRTGCIGTAENRSYHAVTIAGFGRGGSWPLNGYLYRAKTYTYTSP